MAHEIQTWSEIQGDFSDTLLLGNGASIAVHQGFRYDSLYQEAVKRNKLGDAAAVFKAFGEEVHDFELVLRRLWYAKRVYEALKLPCRIYRKNRNRVCSGAECPDQNRSGDPRLVR